MSVCSLILVMQVSAGTGENFTSTVFFGVGCGKEKKKINKMNKLLRAP
jgi:hypothetical protein